MGGPRMPLFFFPDYSFVPVAAMPVRESWQGGDSGKANSSNF
jgi:hypothetical protein